MSDQNRLVLAYSGGLDTSVAISYLKERTGKDVVAVSLDVGQGGESLETIKQRALACGAVEAYVVDARDEFANEYCMKALKANAMYEGVYPLVSAISRPLISKHLVRAAHQFGADTISHGCTGKGNDQVRFEVSIASIDPTLKAISPIRDLSLTRDVEIAFAKEHKLPIVQTEKSPFSIDQNVWGRAIETGFLEDPWNGPTKDCYSYTDDPAFPPVEDEVVIEFKQGVPVKIDGHDVTPLQAIEEMNRRAGAQGIGRIDLIEDRLVGIKSRELYEAPGAVALITAHQELENCCLEREQHRIKRDIDKRWAELVYDAQWFSPATQSLNAFIEDTQKYVSGEIRMVLHGGRAVIKGNHAVLAVIIDAIAITGGAALGADLLAFEIINALDIGAFLHDDDLNAVGVAVGEAHGVLTLGRDGHAGGNDVALAGLDGAQSRVKVHIVDDQLQAQLLRQSVSDLDVDAFKAGALVALAVVRNGLVRRELRVGGHGELAGGHGLDVRTRLGILLATGAQRCDHEDCQKQCNKFLHFISLFLKQNRLGLAPRLVWSYDSTRA